MEPVHLDQADLWTGLGHLITVCTVCAVHTHTLSKRICLHISSNVVVNQSVQMQINHRSVLNEVSQLIAQGFFYVVYTCKIHN